MLLAQRLRGFRKPAEPPSGYRYLRFIATDLSWSNTYSWIFSELEIYEDPTVRVGANIALGKSVTTSYDFTGWPGSNLVDGSDSTGWSSHGSPNSYNWVVIDLGQPFEVCSVRMTRTSTHIQYVPKYIDIQYSSDGTNWTTLTNVSTINDSEPFNDFENLQ